MKRVVLASFHGQLEAPVDGRPQENYWRLIGAHAGVLAPADERGRVLVRFDVSVVDLGLACHNPVPNSLYVLTGDLRSLD